MTTLQRYQHLTPSKKPYILSTNHTIRLLTLQEAGPAETLAVQDVDHFWFGQEINLSDAVYKWINEKLLNKQDEK